MTDSRIDVRQTPDDVVIRAVGRATATSGPGLRELLLAARTRGVRRVEFDLGQCVYMDSTFIGILTMAAVDSRGTALHVRIANAGPLPKGHLASLGVDGLFEYVDSPSPEGPWEPLTQPAHGTDVDRLQSVGRTSLAAHETLGAVDPANVRRFKDVIECLRQEAKGGTP